MSFSFLSFIYYFFSLSLTRSYNNWGFAYTNVIDIYIIELHVYFVRRLSLSQHGILKIILYRFRDDRGRMTMAPTGGYRLLFFVCFLPFSCLLLRGIIKNRARKNERINKNLCEPPACAISHKNVLVSRLRKTHAFFFVFHVVLLSTSFKNTQNRLASLCFFFILFIWFPAAFCRLFDDGLQTHTQTAKAGEKVYLL